MPVFWDHFINDEYKMKLEEGRYYNFVPLRTITLPDSNENLILTGPDGKKYLLPLSFYNEYKLTERSEIVCKVDKINCSGKVFLEPQHPYYKEGEYYPFIFIELVIPEKSSQPGSNTFLVRDSYGNTITAPQNLLKCIPQKGTELQLKVERISKGRLHFSPPARKDEVEELVEGELYEFFVKSTLTDSEGEEYFVVTDINKKEHRLPVKYYGHYGFKKGEKFRGRIVRYSSGSPKSIEPDNPWYKPGDTVEVTVGSYAPDETGINYIADVFDSKGFNYSVKCTEVPNKPVLKCTVLKIRKGRPVLIPLEDK